MASRDTELLNEYCEKRSQPAFAELVRRYADLVHASATRQLRDSHAADDVTQAVFIVLARKAAVVRGEHLAGWLMRTTRFCARDALKSQKRRKRHEQQAGPMNTHVTLPHDSSGSEIAGHLDAALAHLKPRESSAVAMRFLQNKSAAEVADTLGISQDAAQKIIARALPKLQRILTRRGLILSSVAGLTEFMLTASRHAAPADFSLHASPSSLSIAKGAMKIMLWTKIQMTGAIAAGLLVIAGGAGVVINSHSSSATAATGMAVFTAPRPNVMPFASPFLKLNGCRIMQPVSLDLRLNPGKPANEETAVEQEDLEIDFNVAAAVASQADDFVGSIDNSDGTGPSFSLQIGGAAGELHESAILTVPEPGSYLVSVSAIDKNKKLIARATLPLQVSPMPMTQIQIADLQPDTTIQFTSVLQGLNTSNAPYWGGRFRNSDFVHLTQMTDDQGHAIAFQTQHEGSHFVYSYKLPSPVAPGNAIMGSSSGTMAGLITRLGNGSFQYSMNQYPGGNAPVRRIELYRLPAGAKLIATDPVDLPNRIVDGRMQIYMETTIPEGGSHLVSFRYRLTGR